MTVKDKVVIVTGASSGIGRSVAMACSRLGAQVAMLDIDEAGRGIADEIGALFIQADVSNRDQWRDNVAQVESQFGRPDHVHLNAGIMLAAQGAPDDAYAFGALNLESYRKIMGVNVDGVVFGIQACVAAMTEGSSIVVTASLAGVVPYEYDPVYAMTKHAVVGLVRSLGGELGQRGIRINALCPGGIDTTIIPSSMYDPARLMSPDNVAEEVLDLFATETTGAAWAKVSNDKKIFVMDPPGSRRPPA